VKCLICCTGWFLYILEQCVKFITNIAYIQIALTGDNFCQAAFNAVTLAAKFAARFGFGKAIGVAFITFGSILIGALTATASYYFMSNYPALGVNQPIAPAITIGLISSIIGMSFLSVFTFASEAILQSFLLDEEMKFEGHNRPEYM
jgi:hypothetical protein